MRQEDGRETFPRAEVEEHDAVAIAERVVCAGSVGGGGGFHASSPLGVPVNAAKLPADLLEPPSSRARSNYSLF